MYQDLKNSIGISAGRGGGRGTERCKARGGGREAEGQSCLRCGAGRIRARDKTRKVGRDWGGSYKEAACRVRRGQGLEGRLRRGGCGEGDMDCGIGAGGVVDG
ncbi:hypothetical protein E2C01_060394 [Portunus trituberculatus]|uniref:Uncharacterized protein n=1 Tax=Portunus trituberculatus TaxID=210409 RepID=A0A5B7HAC9_PORTR|nr:hypothetical protein [Portunus trituberculatus]